jgi:hypothetical protein
VTETRPDDDGGLGCGLVLLALFVLLVTLWIGQLNNRVTVLEKQQTMQHTRGSE